MGHDTRCWSLVVETELLSHDLVCELRGMGKCEEGLVSLYNRMRASALCNRLEKTVMEPTGKS